MLEKIKELRILTNLGVAECKAALEASDNNVEKAIAYLKTNGKSIVSDTSSKTTVNGLIHTYVHQGKIGVMIELICEKEETGSSNDLKELANDLSMQVASMNPLYINKDNIPIEELEKERKILTEQAQKEGKPANIIEKMIEGRLNKFYAQYCLENQAYIKDDKRMVKDIIEGYNCATKDNIKVRRIVRYKLGE